MMTLAALIAVRKGDDSYDALARRGGMTTSTLHAYAKGENKDFPPPSAVMQLSRAIDVKPWEIVVAAALGLGFEPEVESDDRSTALGRSLPSEVDALPMQSQRAILETARAMVALMYGEREDGDTDPEAVASRAVAAHNSAVARTSSRTRPGDHTDASGRNSRQRSS